MYSQASKNYISYTRLLNLLITIITMAMMLLVIMPTFKYFDKPAVEVKSMKSNIQGYKSLSLK